jgi:hypothetical protein
MMARRAWEYGWPDKDWAPPIKGVLEREKAEARSAVYREQERARQAQEAMRDKARQDAVEARTEEGNVVRAARKNALSMLVSMNQINAGILVLAKELSDFLKATPKMEPMKAVMLMERGVRASRQAGELAHRAIIMERLVLGEPTEIVALTGGADDAFSVDDALDEIQKAQADAERFLRAKHPAGALRVIEGGQSEKKAEEKRDLPPLPPPLPPKKNGVG